MSEEQTNDLDTVDVETVDPEVVAAFEALEATTPEGHLDDFESRLLARLEEETMSEMTNQTAADDIVAAGAGAAMAEAAHEPDDIDAELHDIRVLAESTKKRISKRMEAQPDPDELLPSTSSPALSIVSLPEPKKGRARGDAAPASAAANDDDAGLPAWIYAAISAVAAAAIVFFILRGHKPGTTEQVATLDTPQGAEYAPSDRQQAAASGPGTAIPGNNADSTTSAAGAADSAGEGAIGAGATDNGAAESDAERAADNDAEQNDKDQADTSARSGRRTAGATRSSAGTARTSRSGADKQSKAAGSQADTDQQTETTTDTAKKDTKKDKKPDALEDLLSEASGGAAGPGDTTGGGANPAETKPTRTRLDSSDIKKAMAPVVPKAQACYNQFQVPGMVTVSFSVEPSGKIASSRATGKFKGTDTGNCVANAVKSATLPAYNGAPMTFQYPFLLTQ